MLELGVSRLSSTGGMGRRADGLISGLGEKLSELAAEETNAAEEGRQVWGIGVRLSAAPMEGRSDALQERRIISGVALAEAEGMRRPFMPTISVVFWELLIIWERARRRAPGLVREEAACIACVSSSACESSRCSSHTCIPSILHWRRSAAASASALSTRCCSAALPRSLRCFVRGIAAHPLGR